MSLPGTMSRQGFVPLSYIDHHKERRIEQWGDAHSNLHKRLHVHLRDSKPVIFGHERATRATMRGVRTNPPETRQDNLLSSMDAK
jgi:hypothetical protein